MSRQSIAGVAVVDQPSAVSEPARWLTLEAAGLLALVIAAALVFWAFDALPFMDLPAHAGLIALRHRIAASPFEQQFFVVAPHIGPYSVFRTVAEALLRVTDPLGSVRVLATLPVLATPAAVLFARWRLHADRSMSFGYLAVVLSFGLMTLFGFASYLLGVACWVVALTLWLELMIGADRGEPLLRAKTITVAATAPLVFLAHGHAFLIFALCAGVSSVATGRRQRRLVHLVALGPAVALAAYSAALDQSLPADAVQRAATMTPLFLGPLDKLSLLVAPTLTTRLGVDVAVGAALWCLLGSATVATVRSLRAPAPPALSTEADASRAHSRALLVAAASLAVTFIALPHEIGWFGFVDGRLVPVVLLLCLLAVRRDALGPRLAKTFARLPPLLAFIAVAWMWFASVRFQREAAGYREVFAHVPERARLLNMPIDPDSEIFTGHPFVHYDKLIMIARPIVVSDVWFHQGTGIYPRANNPALKLPLEYNSSTVRIIDWARYRLEDWDYVLIRTRPGSASPATPSELALVTHQGGWWLYRSALAVPVPF